MSRRLLLLLLATAALAARTVPVTRGGEVIFMKMDPGAQESVRARFSLLWDSDSDLDAAVSALLDEHWAFPGREDAHATIAGNTRASLREMAGEWDGPDAFAAPQRVPPPACRAARNPPQSLGAPPAGQRAAGGPEAERLRAAHRLRAEARRLEALARELAGPPLRSDAEAACASNLEAHSQFGQDWYIFDRWLRHVPAGEGVFVEVGAFDGVRGSNTLLFEAQLGWTGLLVEANPAQEAALRAARDVPVEMVAVRGAEGADSIEFLSLGGAEATLSAAVTDEGQHRRYADRVALAEDRRVVTVPLRRLQDVLDDHALAHVHLLSVDVEGGELDVLATGIDWDRVRVDVVVVENFVHGVALRELMGGLGFEVAAVIGVDEVYVHWRLRLRG